MPNWCDNTVTLSHEDTEKVDALERVLVANDEYDGKDSENAPIGIFSHLRPRPADEDENWYGWNIDHWGCKWDATPNTWDRDGDVITINFDTAWSPPTELYEYLVANDWDVTAYYYEPGMAFCGSYDNGVDSYYEIDYNDENWRDNVDEDVIDHWGLEYEYENWKEWNEEEEVETDD